MSQIHLKDYYLIEIISKIIANFSTLSQSTTKQSSQKSNDSNIELTDDILLTEITVSINGFDI